MIQRGGRSPTDPRTAGARAENALSLHEQIAGEGTWLLSIAGLVESVIADDGATMGPTALTKPRLNFVLRAIQDGLKRSADRLAGLALAVESKHTRGRRSRKTR